MNRPWQTWIAFAACLAVVLIAMGWITGTVLDLDRRQVEAQWRAKLDEDVQLALWRMDSSLAPLMARESGRPYFVYSAFYPAERTYNSMFSEIRKGEVLVPSPLLIEEFPKIRLHFQIGPDNRVTSPQAPLGNMIDLAEARYTNSENILSAGARVQRLEQQGVFEKLRAALPPDKSARTRAARPTMQAGMTQGGMMSANQQLGRRGLGQRELQARARVGQQAAEQQVANFVRPEGPGNVVEGLMKPLWLDDQLLLARRTTVGGKHYVQGCLLNWAAIKQELLATTADLLPGADLQPAPAQSTVPTPRMLATLPVRLLPGQAAPAPGPGWSVPRISLLLAWGCVLLAAVAVGILLRGAVTLSERRGAFVSAVTHELRTPLTTFRMYTEMLLEGMVPDERKRTEYLRTLRAEADRLGHLVENVLAYARLERGRARRSVETIRVGDLLDRARERLAARATQAQMRLDVASDDSARASAVRTDVSAAEQILLNLVDNACKYAAGAGDPTILLHAERRDGKIRLTVADHGPGIPKHERGRLFKPFRKSAHQAAESAPGVGLGLALSRRLARQMGGDLQLDDPTQPGARFVLSLPAQ